MNATLLFSTRHCQLFKLMRSFSHCLHHLLPPVRSVSYSLRQRGHPYELLEHKYQKTKCSFIVRYIFDYFRPVCSLMSFVAKFLSLIWWLLFVLLIVWFWCKCLYFSGTLIKNLLTYLARPAIATILLKLPKNLQQLVLVSILQLVSEK